MTNDASKWEKAATGILRTLRSQGFSYGDTSRVLDHAGRLLQLMIDMELSYLAMADGIEDRFNPDCLSLSSKEIADAHLKCPKAC